MRKTFATSILVPVIAVVSLLANTATAGANVTVLSAGAGVVQGAVVIAPGVPPLGHVVTGDTFTFSSATLGGAFVGVGLNGGAAVFVDDSFGVSATGAAVGPESVAGGQGTLQVKLNANPTTGVVGTLSFTNATNSLDGVFIRVGGLVLVSLSGAVKIAPSVGAPVVDGTAHVTVAGLFQPAQTPYDPTTQTVTNATFTGVYVNASPDHT